MFDLRYNTNLCPTERNALKEFFDVSKGGEWTDSTNWTDPYMSHCFWRGISCVESIVTELDLANNGLSGKLTAKIANLSSLVVLDLSDNDIKVSFV